MKIHKGNESQFVEDCEDIGTHAPHARLCLVSCMHVT